MSRKLDYVNKGRPFVSHADCECAQEHGDTQFECEAAAAVANCVHMKSLVLWPLVSSSNLMADRWQTRSLRHPARRRHERLKLACEAAPLLPRHSPLAGFFALPRVVVLFLLPILLICLLFFRIRFGPGEEAKE